MSCCVAVGTVGSVPPTQVDRAFPLEKGSVPSKTMALAHFGLCPGKSDPEKEGCEEVSKHCWNWRQRDRFPAVCEAVMKEGVSAAAASGQSCLRHSEVTGLCYCAL